MGFIYKITNKTNGKAYIGKTLQTPENDLKNIVQIVKETDVRIDHFIEHLINME